MSGEAPRPEAEGDCQILRYYNNADIALNELYEAAKRNAAARELLRDIAEKLVDRAGRFSSLKTEV